MSATQIQPTLGLIAVERGNSLADGTQPWAVIDGHEIDGEVLAEGLSEKHARLFAAAPKMKAALLVLMRMLDGRSPRPTVASMGELEAIVGDALAATSRN